jgi:hypothetical protein
MIGTPWRTNIHFPVDAEPEVNVAVLAGSE